MSRFRRRKALRKILALVPVCATDSPGMDCFEVWQDHPEKFCVLCKIKYIAKHAIGEAQ